MAAQRQKRKKPVQTTDLDPRWGILLFAAGAFLALLAVIPGENGWAWMRQNLLFGTFGVSGWLLGALTVFWAVLVSLQKPLFEWVVRGVVFMLCLSGLALVFGGMDFTGLNFWQALKALHANGYSGWFTGGVLGGVLGGSLLALFGRTAARAIMVLGLLVGLMILFKIGPGDIARFVAGAAGKLPRPQRAPRAEEEEADAPPWEEEPPAEAPPPRPAKRRRRGAATPKAMPALMGPGRRRSLDVDIDLGPEALQSEEGLNDHDEVTIGPGGTFGMNPLEAADGFGGAANGGDSAFGLPTDGPLLPFIKAGAGNAFEQADSAERMLLFGQDDPYAKLGGTGTKLAPEALPEIEYLGPPPAPEFDLFGQVGTDADGRAINLVETLAEAAVSAAATGPVAGGAGGLPFDLAPAAMPRQGAAGGFAAADNLAANADTRGGLAAQGNGEGVARPAGDMPRQGGPALQGDAPLDAMIDRAAAEKPSARRAEAPGPFQPVEATGAYSYPPIGLFAAPAAENSGGAKEEMKRTAELLVSTLSSFGVQTRILDVSRGPSVTRYEIQPQAGVKISKITGLADDIALNLAAAGVRIEAPIPGKPAVGIEVPNHQKTPVSIRSILESEAFRTSSSALPIALGMDIAGESVVADLTKMPHLLIAGSTGSGKSVCVNATIMSFLYRSSPEDVRLLLIDPKVVELAEYNGIPHLLMPVVTEPRKAAGALGSAVAEMERRYHLFAENNVRDIRTFNKLAAKQGDLEKIPYIAIVIDELADLMMTAGKQVEDYICRIAQKARAAGMHLIVATQRPSVDVITGLIKANIPSRIAFAVSSQVDSRTILDSAGADKLLGMGDMLFMPVGANKPVRVQGTYVQDKEITSALQYIKDNCEARYDEEMIEEMERRSTPEAAESEEGEGGGEDMLHDPVFISAVETALESGQISTSFLQRRLRLGYARAGRIMDEMERLHIVSPPDGSKPRQVLIGRQQWLEMSINASE